MAAKRAWLPPFAFVATGAMIWLAGRATPVTAAAPLVLPGLWVAVWLTDRRARSAMWAALGVVVGAIANPPVVAVICAGYVAAGLAGGVVLGRGASWLAAVAVVGVVLLPGVVAAVLEVPVTHQVAEAAAGMQAAYVEQLPASMSAAERDVAAAEMRRQLDGMLKVTELIWPAMIAVGLALQAALALWSGMLLARVVGWPLVRPPGRPFAAWEAPPVFVWVLAAGLAIMLLGGDAGRLAGSNLAILAAGLLAVQGLAIQVWFTSRFVSPAVRVVYWALVAFFLAPVAVAAGAVIGLVDQWWDLRGLRRGSEQEGGSRWM